MIDYHYFFLIGSVLVAAVSQVLLKKGALHHYDSWIREYLNPWVITGYILMFGSVFLSIMGLRGVDFFNAPVIDSLGYVLVPVCDNPVLGRDVRAAQIHRTFFVIIQNAQPHDVAGHDSDDQHQEENVGLQAAEDRNFISEPPE